MGVQSKSVSRQPKKIKKVSKYTPYKVDYVILSLTLLMIIFGVIMVYSSSYYVALVDENLNDSTFYLKKQATYAVIGILAMYTMSKFCYKLFENKIVWFLYIASFLLVAYTNKFGIERNYAKRWLSIAGVFTLQPSDLSKVAIILLVPYLILKHKHFLRTKVGHIILLIPVILMAGIVGKENMSTAIIIILIGVGILFIASPKTAIFIFSGIAGVTALILYFALGTGFRNDRFIVWLDPFSDPTGVGFQIIQSLYAVASGGLFGLGLGNSRQKLSFIPEPHNDIIFAIICEELGLFGAGILLIGFIVLIWRGFNVSLKCPDAFGSMVAAGIVIMIAVQVVINVSVVTNTIPNTGIALPFISSGGTALIVTCGLMGILLNISKSFDD